MLIQPPPAPKFQLYWLAPPVLKLLNVATLPAHTVSGPDIAAIGGATIFTVIYAVSLPHKLLSIIITLYVPIPG